VASLAGAEGRASASSVGKGRGREGVANFSRGAAEIDASLRLFTQWWTRNSPWRWRTPWPSKGTPRSSGERGRDLIPGKCQGHIWNPDLHFTNSLRHSFCRCHVQPERLRPWVRVTSWMHEEGAAVEILPEDEPRGKYTLLTPQGHLVVHHTSAYDAYKRYTCRAQHVLTGAVAASARSARLTLEGSSLPLAVPEISLAGKALLPPVRGLRTARHREWLAGSCRPWSWRRTRARGTGDKTFASARFSVLRARASAIAFIA